MRDEMDESRDEKRGTDKKQACGISEMKEQQRSNDLRERTKQFALRIIQLASMMPRTREADIIAKQVVKSSSSVGANYREASRARSKAEFTAKVGVVEQEADETLYWLEIIHECNWVKQELVDSLISEADELVAIFTTIGKKSKCISPRMGDRV